MNVTRKAAEAVPKPLSVLVSVIMERSVPGRTMVFQLIGSTNELTTSPTVSATTRARPTCDGSRCIHVSHSTHWRAIAGMRWDIGLHLLMSYICAHVAISSARPVLP